MKRLISMSAFPVAAAEADPWPTTSGVWVTVFRTTVGRIPDPVLLSRSTIPHE